MAHGIDEHDGQATRESDTDAQQVVETPGERSARPYERLRGRGILPTLFPYGKGGHMPASEEEAPFKEVSD